MGTSVDALQLEDRVGEHFLHHRQLDITSGERRHHLASIRLDVERIETGDRTRDLGLGDEAHDADHGQPTVVDLGNEALLLALRRHLRGEAKRIKQVERHRVWELALERREVARLAATDIVLLAIHLKHCTGLRPHLEEADEAEDLELGRGGERVPLVSWATRGRDGRVRDDRRIGEGASDWALQIPREVDAVGLDAVANEGGHGDATVLDLRVAEPANGLRPRVSIDDVQRVPEADHGVELLSERDHARLVGDLGRANPRLGALDLKHSGCNRTSRRGRHHHLRRERDRGNNKGEHDRCVC
mmetsp:Transcript_25134/g.54293  ORF Transcript_25134/g.54293 Transcript_25134/m.54293 type:complete len:302 (-) Transcript_25134:53-958(-)